MVECLKAKTAHWDKRMTAAYQQALKDAEPKQREQLRVAQRLWIQYRDANCLYYDLGEGTIARIEAGDCMQDHDAKPRASSSRQRPRSTSAGALLSPICCHSQLRHLRRRSLAAAGRRAQIGLAHQLDRNGADQRLERGDQRLVIGARGDSSRIAS